MHGYADPHEPLAAHARELTPPELLSGLRCTRFEYSSRGDRIPGRLLRPAASDGPLPLVLL